MTHATRPADGRHLPAIHLNGTGRAGLQDNLARAHRALDAALTALAAAGPNRRDYYILPDADAHWRAALAEHERRLDAVRALLDDVTADALALDEIGR
jgi:hypothetical protein